MADKVASPKKTETVAEEKVEKVEKTKATKTDEEVVEDKPKAQNGEAEEKENGSTEKDNEETEEKDKACPVKRKSEVGDAKEDEKKPSEGATPEKKAKLEEKVEAESNGESEVKA